MLVVLSLFGLVSGYRPTCASLSSIFSFRLHILNSSIVRDRVRTTLADVGYVDFCVRLKAIQRCRIGGMPVL